MTRCENDGGEESFSRIIVYAGSQTDHQPPDPDDPSSDGANTLQQFQFPFPKSRVPVQEAQCSICSMPYSDHRKVALLECNHMLCVPCIDSLLDDEKNYVNRFMKTDCPFCRQPTFRNGYRVLLFTSVEALLDPERVKYKKGLSFIRLSHVTKARGRIEELLIDERQAQKHVRVPLYCSRKQIEKKRSDYLAFLTKTKSIRLLEELKLTLECIDKYLNVLIMGLTIPPRHLSFDATSAVAKCILKVLKKGNSGYARKLLRRLSAAE